MQIAPSTYYARKKTGPISAAMLTEAYDAHAVYLEFVRQRGVYGVRKMWHATWRAGHTMGRDQVARLLGIAGSAEWFAVGTARQRPTRRHSNTTSRSS